MRRVLRLGGRLLLWDNVRASSRLGRTRQRLLESLAIRFGGDHLLRRPLEQVEAQSFVVEHRERYKLGTVERLDARKPGCGWRLLTSLLSYVSSLPMRLLGG
jgi:hypothetical protein